MEQVRVIAAELVPSDAFLALQLQRALNLIGDGQAGGGHGGDSVGRDAVAAEVECDRLGEARDGALGAVPGEIQGDAPADAAARPGDDRHLILQPTVHATLLGNRDRDSDSFAKRAPGYSISRTGSATVAVPGVVFSPLLFSSQISQS